MIQTVNTITQVQGDSPLVVSVPHSGTSIPAAIRSSIKKDVQWMPDTDWFVDRLYEWVPTTGASMIVTPWSRYVIDLNRPPDNAPLYSNNAGSSLVPVASFDGVPLYEEGRMPDQEEVAYRHEEFWLPYHRELSELLNTACDRHGYAILLDAHSIRSEVPDLFDGELPHLNLGTNSGASAAQSLVEEVWDILGHSEYSAVQDQRFKGGYITRHYGQPDKNIHALQLEIAQRTYMQESPPEWDSERANALQLLLKAMVAMLNNWRPEGGV